MMILWHGYGAARHDDVHVLCLTYSLFVEIRFRVDIMFKSSSFCPTSKKHENMRVFKGL